MISMDQGSWDSKKTALPVCAHLVCLLKATEWCEENSPTTTRTKIIKVFFEKTAG